MFLLILGLIDIGMALMLLLTAFGLPVGYLYILFTIAHAAKAIAFIRNFLSIVDVAILFYTLIAPFWHNEILTFFIVGFLIYKGLYSLF